MPKKSKEINFLDSFVGETSVVPRVINTLINDCNKMRIHQDEITEIVLSMDEAITNAIQETIRKDENLPIYDNDDQRREITIRYTITEQEFNATIIDHGKGLDLKCLAEFTPNSDDNNYHEQVLKYSIAAEQHRLKVRLNGMEMTLKGIGAGLKIILAFMDSVTIDFIDKQSILSDCVTQFTDGTILNLIRKRRYGL